MLNLTIQPVRPSVLTRKACNYWRYSRPGRLLNQCRPRRQDYEYVRRGTRNVFIFVEKK